MDQFCICGTQPGYQHPATCPYPLFNAAPDSESELKWLSAARRLEIDAWLQQEGAIVIRVEDLGAALEAQHYGKLAVHLATGAVAYPPPHPGPPLCAIHAAHLARRALGLC